MISYKLDEVDVYKKLISDLKETDTLYKMAVENQDVGNAVKVLELRDRLLLKIKAIQDVPVDIDY
jgi:hypothetical protein